MATRGDLTANALDLFAGPGGWSEAARVLGVDELGIEIDPSACATRAAAGHATVRADVAVYPPDRFRVGGLVASPPCPSFSVAGKRTAELDRLYGYVHAYRRAGWVDPWTVHEWRDRRTPLVLEPLRWVETIRPEWVALEQVPPVLELWEQFAAVWRHHGYSVWTGILNAADYGVPQTRRRAFLLASRTRAVHPPAATHCRGGSDTLFGGMEPWVSMADALGWGMTERPYPVIASGRTTGGPDKEKVGGSRARALVYAEQAEGRWMVNTGRDWKPGGSRADAQTIPVDEPAPTVDGKGRWHLVPGNGDHRPYHLGEPAPTVAFGHDSAKWCWDRSATTVVGSFRPHMVTPPGHRTWADGTPRQDSEGAVRVTLSDALVLQSFRPDYPLQGSRSKQFEQVGNAVPPLLAAAVLGALVS